MSATRIVPSVATSPKKTTTPSGLLLRQNTYTIPGASPRKTRNATHGVWVRAVTFPVTLGSSPSRPELKMIRACELVAEIRLETIEVKPAM